MSDLLERYEAQYGAAASGYLYTLGGDPAAIVAEIERTQAAPEADPLAFLAPLMPTTPEQDAHNAIMREIQRLYFLPISRASALAVCNVLGEAGELTPSPACRISALMPGLLKTPGTRPTRTRHGSPLTVPPC